MLYMPLLHAEDAALQAKSVELFEALYEDAKAKGAGTLSILQRFHVISIRHKQVYKPVRMPSSKTTSVAVNSLFVVVFFYRPWSSLAAFPSATDTSGARAPRQRRRTWPADPSLPLQCGTHARTRVSCGAVLNNVSRVVLVRRKR
jgi:hypothetical protein